MSDQATLEPKARVEAIRVIERRAEQSGKTHTRVTLNELGCCDLHGLTVDTDALLYLPATWFAERWTYRCSGVADVTDDRTKVRQQVPVLVEAVVSIDDEDNFGGRTQILQCLS